MITPDVLRQILMVCILMCQFVAIKCNT